MRADEFRHDRQPDSASGDAARPLSTPEALEHVRKLRLRNARSGVRDAKECNVSVRSSLEDDFPSDGRELERVPEKVVDDLA